MIPALILDIVAAVVDEDRVELLRLLPTVPTDELLDVERIGIRLVWAVRDERVKRERQRTD